MVTLRSILYAVFSVQIHFFTWTCSPFSPNLLISQKTFSVSVPPLCMITHVLKLCIGLLRMAIRSPQRAFSNPILLVITREINVALSYVITPLHCLKDWASAAAIDIDNKNSKIYIDV